MRVYGNSETVVSCGETTAFVRIDGVCEQISIVIVDDHVQSYEMIVGRSFIECDNVTFIKTNKKLLFAYGMRFSFHGTEVPDTPSVFTISFKFKIHN
jgi:hypothetical protein